ncbi:MAG: pirin family protein [Sphaerochaetaceae bacterium]
MTLRPIKRITGGSEQYDGAGVKLVRVIGYADVYDFDPFLMLDVFDSDNPDDYTKGFPWHPHRGIETVTYLIKGDIEHGDSLGNKGSINDGCCQWMTAGSGIIHQEMPQACLRMLGAQLWINLPKKDKMTVPAYRDIRDTMIPLCKEEGTEVRIISGQYKDTVGPKQGDYVSTLYFDVKLEPFIHWSFTADSSNTVFCYFVEGAALVSKSKEPVPRHKAVLFGEGDTIDITATGSGVRFFLFAGKPLKEPIAWNGPIVMNTQEELRTASRELQDGTFIKHK